MWVTRGRNMCSNMTISKWIHWKYINNTYVPFYLHQIHNSIMFKSVKIRIIIKTLLSWYLQKSVFFFFFVNVQKCFCRCRVMFSQFVLQWYNKLDLKSIKWKTPSYHTLTKLKEGKRIWAGASTWVFCYKLYFTKMLLALYVKFIYLKYQK